MQPGWVTRVLFHFRKPKPQIIPSWILRSHECYWFKFISCLVYIPMYIRTYSVELTITSCSTERTWVPSQGNWVARRAGKTSLKPSGRAGAWEHHQNEVPLTCKRRTWELALLNPLDKKKKCCFKPLLHLRQTCKNASYGNNHFSYIFLGYF